MLRSVPWRSAMIALLPVLALGSAVRTAPAQRARATTVLLVQHDLRAYPESFTLCVGQSAALTVGLVRRMARPPSRGQRPRWHDSVVDGAMIKAVVVDPHVGDLTGDPTARARTGSGQGPLGPLAGTGAAVLTFTANNPGRTAITFTFEPEDELAPLTPEGEDHLAPLVPVQQIRNIPARPAVAQVEVSSCKWKVTTRSEWRVPAGFRPEMTSNFEAVVDFEAMQEVPGHPGIYQVSAPVTNQASGHPVAGCVPSFTVPPTTADIHALWSSVGDELLLSLYYDPVHATTKIVCPGGGGGRPMDIGTPLAAPLLNLRFPVSGGTKTVRQILKVQMPRPMDVVGQTTLIVTQIIP